MAFDHHRRCHHGMYRLSCEDFDALYRYADGRCQICRTPEADVVRGRLDIDHAPDYGFYAVRGLLCARCNTLMKYVDNGSKYDARGIAYQSDAWFVRLLVDRHAARSGKPPRTAPPSVARP